MLVTLSASDHSMEYSFSISLIPTSLYLMPFISNNQITHLQHTEFAISKQLKESITPKKSQLQDRMILYSVVILKLQRYTSKFTTYPFNTWFVATKF